ncbi:hypothetical protein LINPERPRIM_LOCUS1067 [Linum perenne]
MLWGYEGPVQVSCLSKGFFLLELHLEKLDEWVISRPWHIHHSALILRRWDEGIEALDLMSKEIPTWIVLKVGHLSLITPEGISWIASQIGTKINKFTRIGY